MIKWIRAVPVINQVVRNALRWSSRCILFLENRWRVSGTIGLKFNHINFKYFSHSDDSLADILFYKKAYAEDADIKAFVEIVAKAKVIFDIGANTGLYTIIGATVNPSSSFYSFEPHPGNCTRLRKNIELNNLHHVTVVPKAVGNTNSSIQFFVPETGEIIDTSSALGDFSESTYQGEVSWDSIFVSQVTLDDVVEENAIPWVDLIKIDVEGYEIPVFEGSLHIFENFKPVIICEIFLDDEKKKYFQGFIREFGYVPYMILAEGLIRLDEGLIPNVSGLNYLFSVVRSEKVFTPMNEVNGLINERRSD